MQHRLTEHMNWTRQQITSWLTEEQKLLGLNGTFIFSALTEDWHRKRPLWLSLLLSQLKPTAVARLGSPVLDIFLAQLAMQLNKTVGAVETDDEQCRAFNSLSDSLTVSILNSTLGALEKNKL